MLLKPEIQHYIDAHIGVDTTSLAFQKNPFPDVTWHAVLNQISAKTKAKSKLPTWFETKQIIYPPKISIEQTSSEITAAYKAQLVSGDSLIDLAGGFGVDAYFFSKTIRNAVHCEINRDLSEIVKHNFAEMQATNITCLYGDSRQILQKLDRKFDWIYVDPSRRNESKGKVFLLKDCLPNVPDLMDFYFSYADNLLIKTAPLLDIAAGLSELSHVKTIHIIAVENEVKELLWVISKNYSGDIAMKTINITKDAPQRFDFILNQNPGTGTYGLPQKYLYEPNAAIMKSGGFEQISIQFKFAKLHRHSHLYTSDELIDFPGRSFVIGYIITYTKAEMELFFKNKKANITTRNFPDSVENIRKKYNIKDGGSQYCFFTTDANDNKIVLICTKIYTP